jgi:hypothetical protein
MGIGPHQQRTATMRCLRQADESQSQWRQTWMAASENAPLAVGTGAAPKSLDSPALMLAIIRSAQDVAAVSAARMLACQNPPTHA